MDVRIVLPKIADDLITYDQPTNEINTIVDDNSDFIPDSPNYTASDSLSVEILLGDSIFILFRSIYGDLLNLPINERKPIKQTLNTYLSTR